jgi:hypothetical protein
MASFIRTVKAPPIPKSSAIIGSPNLLEATTMLPSLILVNPLILPYLSRMSFKSVARARTAIHSLATAMSNPVSREKPFSVGDCPTVIVLKKRSLTSRTRFLGKVSAESPGEIPCDTVRIDIKSRKPSYFSLGQFIWVGFSDLQLL